MPTDESQRTGRTLWDVISDGLARKSFVTTVAIVALLILAGIGYLWYKGKVGFVAQNQNESKESKPTATDNQGSPYIWWDDFVTTLPLNQCEGLVRDVYRLRGIEITDPPDIDDTSVAVFGEAGSVTSVIVCLARGDKRTVMVMSAGPDDTLTKNHQKQLRDETKSRLPSSGPTTAPRRHHP
jgi:hypothetical protein